MLENVNIDSIMKDYYYSICSDKLMEDKIDIDENLSVENSSIKYLQLFACFLNESYYNGYIISESIMKKLMDVIEYEGYEYQILEKYIDILFEAMNNYHCDDDNRPTYRQAILDPEQSKKFINEYIQALELIKNDTITSIEIPHFRNPESTVEDKQFQLKILNEVEYPIDIMYKNITNGIINDYNKIFAEHMKVIYENNIDAYRSLILQYKSPYGLFFLLDRTDDKALDILCDNISSLPELASIIDSYEYYLGQVITDNRTPYKFDEIVNNNIRRLIEILTINVSIDQTAMIIGLDIDTWKTYCENNDHRLKTLSMAVALYENNIEKYRMIDSINYVYNIRTSYPDDAYFYARNTLLNMDYKLLCDNFATIYSELSDQIDEDKLLNLYAECVIGLINLKKKEVDDALIKAYNNLNDVLYCKEYKKVLSLEKVSDSDFKLTDSMFVSNITNIKKSVIEYLKDTIESNLLYRRGKFNPEWIPKETSIAVDYKSFIIGESFKNNIIFENANSIETGSVFANVDQIESMNHYFKIIDEDFIDEFAFKYTAKYIEIPDAVPDNYYDSYFNTIVDLKVICKDNKKFIIRQSSFNNPGKYLIGVFDHTTNKFIYANHLIAEENTAKDLLKYTEQIQNNVTAPEGNIISLVRELNDSYYVLEDEYAKTRLELADDFDKKDGKQTLVLLKSTE